MNDEKPKVATPEAPTPTDSGLVAQGQAHSTADASPEAKLDRSKGELPATIDGALDDLILQEPRKYGVVAVLRMLAVWARGTQQISERVAALREENAALRAQIRADRKYRPLRITALLLTPIIGGMGIEQIAADYFGTGIALIIVAGILLGVTLYVGRGQPGDE